MNTKAEKPLTDLRRVHIDTHKPVEDRTRDLVDIVGDIYHYKVGDITVNLCFDPDGKTLADSLTCLMIV